MFDNLRWKFILIISILAMIVSIISGGIHGIRFGVILTRAALGGVVFGVLAVFLNLLAVKFFPELTGDTSGEVPEINEENTAGSNIDITLSSETPEKHGSEEENLNSSGSSESSDPADVETGNSESEVLPTDQFPGDIDKYSGTFEDAGTDKVSGLESHGTGRTSGASGFENDPEELAKAIKTVIRRDEKG